MAEKIKNGWQNRFKSTMTIKYLFTNSHLAAVLQVQDSSVVRDEGLADVAVGIRAHVEGVLLGSLRMVISGESLIVAIIGMSVS